MRAHEFIEAIYRGRKVSLNKPTRGDVKKFKVFVINIKIKKIMKIIRIQIKIIKYKESASELISVINILIY
jgi:hypothetical protein